MKQIDLLLVNPGGRKQVYQNLSNSLSAIEPPIWVGLMATFIRKKGFSVSILDTNALGLDPVETAQKVSDINPLLTVVVAYGQNPSASTMVMPSASAICKALKEERPEGKVILVGGHVAALPEQTLEEEVADYVCDGEGPHTLHDLLLCLKNNSENIKNVRGLLYMQGNQIVRNPHAPLITDLDEDMPEMAWDLLNMDKYRAHNWHCFAHLEEREPYASLYTTLGCPFHCDFCCIQAPFKTGEKTIGYSAKVNSYRRWHPDKIIAQIDLLVNKYGVKNIKFADEIFVMNKKHVNNICDQIIERGYDLNIWAYARVDSWSPETLDKMKKAGINWLCLGIESGSDRVRRDVQKGYKPDNLFKAVDAIQKSGIYIIANYLFGLPEEDSASMQKTLDVALELCCEFANFYCAMAYPGSDLYNRAKAENLPLPDSWTGYSQHAYDTLPLPTKYLSGAEVLRFRDKAFQAYFTDKAYLRKIKDTFGQNTVDHINQMAAHKLERKYA